MSNELPTTGRIVHYVSHGSPVQPDGTQRYPSVCRAALVTADANPDRSVSLAVVNPTGLFFDLQVPASFDDPPAPGSWHWPMRCPCA